MTKLFKATIGVAELLRHAKAKLGLVTGDNVVQLIHRGNPIRVIMTQEHYLNLLDRASNNESSGEYVSEAEMESVLEEVRKGFAQTQGKDLKDN